MKKIALILALIWQIAIPLNAVADDNPFGEPQIPKEELSMLMDFVVDEGKMYSHLKQINLLLRNKEITADQYLNLMYLWESRANDMDYGAPCHDNQDYQVLYKNLTSLHNKICSGWKNLRQVHTGLMPPLSPDLAINKEKMFRDGYQEIANEIEAKVKAAQK